MKPSDLFTRAAAARYVGVSRQRAHQWAAVHPECVVTIHGLTFVQRHALDAWKAARAERFALLTSPPTGVDSEP